MTGEPVFDLDRQEMGECCGVINNGGGSVWVKFPSEAAPILYTFRSALGVWKAFPGSADAQGLRPILF
jgi:hypothetical protein